MGDRVIRRSRWFDPLPRLGVQSICSYLGGRYGGRAGAVVASELCGQGYDYLRGQPPPRLPRQDSLPYPRQPYHPPESQGSVSPTRQPPLVPSPRQPPLEPQPQPPSFVPEPQPPSLVPSPQPSPREPQPQPPYYAPEPQPPLAPLPQPPLAPEPQPPIFSPPQPRGRGPTGQPAPYVPEPEYPPGTFRPGPPRDQPRYFVPTPDPQAPLPSDPQFSPTSPRQPSDPYRGQPPTGQGPGQRTGPSSPSQFYVAGRIIVSGGVRFRQDLLPNGRWVWTRLDDDVAPPAPSPPSPVPQPVPPGTPVPPGPRALLQFPSSIYRGRGIDRAGLPGYLLPDQPFFGFPGTEVTLIPIPNPFFFFDFGLGETKIAAQKEAIQNFLTPALQFATRALGLQLRDGHALQFKSEGVQRWVGSRGDLQALIAGMMKGAGALATSGVGVEQSGPGIEQRLVNQFLANAAINSWSAADTSFIWNSLLASATT